MTRIGAVILMSVCAAGCVSALSEKVESAPEWFQTKQSEIKGADYPTFEQAAKMQADSEALPWPGIQASLENAKREMETADAAPVDVTEEEMRAWAAEQKALVAKGEEPY